MADAQASGACYGNIVWVQVPSSAVKRAEMLSFFARKQFAMHGQDENRALKACFQASWSQIGRIRRMPRQSQAAKRRRDLSAWRIASYNFPNTEKSCRICDSFLFVEPTGLEPMTSRTSSGRSSQLSYGSILCSSEKDSGTDGARTRDLSRVRRTLIPAELRFHDPVRFSLTSPSEYLCILLHCL